MKKASKTFQDLIVWQKAHQFVLGTYSLTKKLNLLLQEVSKLLNAYRQAILDSES